MELIILILIVSVVVYFYKKKRKKKKIYQAVSRFHNKENKEKDSFEGWFYEEVKDYISLNKIYKIKYKDAFENITNRKINIKKYGKAKFGGFILAHCFLRDEARTFRTDRILEFIDAETGEFVNDVSSYLENIYINSEEYKNKLQYEKEKEEKEISKKYFDDFMNKYNVLLKILVYLIRCDGTYTAMEKGIIKELFESLEGENELLTDKFLNKILSKHIMPTERIFKISVNKFIKENKHLNINLIEIAENIISTQKTIHPNEAEALRYLSEKIPV